MSELAGASRQSSAVSQLPVSVYFDERILELEKIRLFDAGPGYAGHALMAPGPGDYRSSEWSHHSRLIYKDGQGQHWFMFNICRHR